VCSLIDLCMVVMTCGMKERRKEHLLLSPRPVHPWSLRTALVFGSTAVEDIDRACWGLRPEPRQAAPHRREALWLLSTHAVAIVIGNTVITAKDTSALLLLWSTMSHVDGTVCHIVD
jgi:hypothetical protein